MEAIIRLLLAITITAALAGCMGQPQVNGRQLYMQHCAGCHGLTGHGDGRMGHGLVTRPADLTRLSARNGGTYPRDFVLSKMDGYAAGAHNTSAMPEFGKLLRGRTVKMQNADGSETPVPEPLLAISQYLERLQSEV
ncbi:MAG: c-type cytochrome [Pseudomonadota bacterium]